MNDKKKRSVSKPSKKASKAKVGSDAVYVAASSVVSRRNQNNTVVLLKADEMGLFYKIDGIAAEVWMLLKKPRSVEALVDHFSELYPANKNSFAANIQKFLAEALENGLLERSKEKATSIPEGEAPSAGKRDFGEIKKFDLEQIETEVLNESIYLDVFAGSDLSLKTKLEPIEGALMKVTQLDGIKFRWNKKNVSAPGVSFTSTHAGLIAQQVAELMPELVRADKKTGKLAVEYSKLVAYLVEAIKELHQTVSLQETRIKKLERKNARTDG